MESSKAAAPSDLTSLPIIDLARAREPTQRLAVARQLVHALETVGFLFLDNVEGYESERLLKIARWFFNLQEAQKRRVSRKLWNPDSQNHYRGYFPLQPGEISYKEGFEIGQDGDIHTTGARDPEVHPFFVESNLWPQLADGVEQFKEDMLQHYRAMLECGSEVLRLVSLGCGLEESWFESMFFPDSLSTLRLLHYPPRSEIPQAAMDGDSILCCSEHSDSGFVTLLATFSYGGLQVKKEDGCWTEVAARPDSLVMNIGDMLSAMSGGKFKATNHRVVDTRQDRFSVPFFFEPRYSADIAKVMPLTQMAEVKVTRDEGEVRSKKTYGPWLIDKMRSFAEYREILESLSSASRQL